MNTFVPDTKIESAKVNENFSEQGERIDREAALARQFSIDRENTTGLTLSVFGGNFNAAAVPGVVVALDANETNYVELDLTDPGIVINTTGFQGTGFEPLWALETDDLDITNLDDSDADRRAWIRLGGGGGSGETNTASNAGSGEGLLFKVKTGVDLVFKTLKLGSSKVDITNNASDVTIDVVEANLTLGEIGGTLGARKGGTGLTALALGELIYASAANVSSRLSGNTTTTRKFLRQTGNGTDSAAPAWDTLAAGDYPAMLGADGTSGGTRGAVPAPVATDNTKYLRGDGTWQTAPGAGGGETNTASNVGTSGVGIFKDKSGVDLRFKKLLAGSNVTITATGADEVEIAASGGGGASDIRQIWLFS